MRHDHPLRSLRQRIDAHLSVALFEWVTFLGLLVSAFMAWLRYRQGNHFQMVVDIGITVVLAVCFAAMVYGIKRDNVARLAAVLCSIGVVISAWVDPASGTHWAFVVFVVCFILFKHNTALLISLGALGIIAMRLWATGSTIDFSGFAASGLLVVGFNFLFAVREEKLRAQLRSFAMQDPLTGLGNRRAFNRRIEYLMHEAGANDQGIGMFMLDLDYFKTVNDRFGHAVGDQVLIDFARIIRHNSRSIDELFRLGGEEFVLLLPGMDECHMANHGDALLGVIRAELKAGNAPVTTSIGASIWRKNEPLKAWMARADEALYEAKEKGRDRIVVR